MTRMPYRGAPGAGGEIAGGPLQRARIALMNNQPAVAVDICRKRLEKKPDEVLTRLMLAQALVQLRQSREGIAEARRVLDSQPNNVDALMLLSAALMGSNQFNPPKEALTSAQRAVQLQPKAARTHVQLAEVLMVQRQFDQAREEADEAVKLDPKLGAAYMIKGMALMNSKDYENAAQSFQAALRQDRTMAAAQFGLAQALAELHRPDEALEALNKAQQLNPYLPAGQVTQLRAQIYRKQRHYGQAYNEYLSLARSGRRSNFFTPVIASFSFFLSFFGRAAPAVVIIMLVAIFFGISRIPLVGGGIVDALVIALVGFLGWQVTKQFGNASPLALLRNPLALVTAVVGAIIGLAVVFVISAKVTNGHHWFNALSFGIAAAVALIIAGVAINFTPKPRQA